MGNLAIIDITGLALLAQTGVLGGDSAFLRSLAWASSIPEYGGTILLAGPGDPLPDGCLVVSGEEASAGELRAIVRDTWTEESLVSALNRVSQLDIGIGEEIGKRPEAFFFARGDSPLIDSEITQSLWKLHYRYDAEYTFADGYPAGLAPQVLSPDLPEKLLPLSRGRGGEVERDSLFEVLRQDINAFDVETHLSPEDLRMDRISITCDTRRNLEITERLYAAGGTDAASLCRIIPENRCLLRSLPIYFPIQITDHCPQACSYCPFPKNGSDPRDGREYMDSGAFTALCGKIVEFSGDAIFNLSLWGEPASHPDIAGLIRSALAAGEGNGKGKGEPARSKVIIETSGIGWKDSILEELAAEAEEGRLMWIVSLDASDPELYRTLRGEGLHEAEETARTLNRLFGRHCWIQAVRMLENEEHLEDFYRKWKDEGAQVIVQKYDSYANFLPQKQPADLSPLNRFACWHLKRDMSVLLDGSVPTCRVQLGRESVLGNAFNDKLADIWAAGEDLFQRHVAGEYPGVCAVCDEYYTFNF